MDEKTAVLITTLKSIGNYNLPEIVRKALDRYEEAVTKEKAWQQVTKKLPNCSSCQAMKRRLVSIAQGCRSIEGISNKCDHDDDCLYRGGTLTAIYNIAVGKHNWPKAMPYEPITKEDLDKI